MPLKTDLIKSLCQRLGKSPYHGAAGLVLAVSGGLDSMVLLDVFQRLAPLHAAPMRVVHVHHGTGAYADAALALVQAECARRQLALRLHRLPPWQGNFEYEAALFRRRVFTEECGPGEYVVLAHHLQDQAETVLQTLARGAGVATPLGMAPNHGERLRPLLDIDRSLIVDHATRVGVAYLDDPSNEDVVHFRNLLRHRVLPLMRDFHQDLDRQLAGFADEWREVHHSLEEEAASRFARGFRCAQRLLVRGCLDDAPPYLRPFILRCFWRACGVANPHRREAQQLTAWLAEGRTGCFDHQGLRFWCDRDALVLEPAPAMKAVNGRFGEALDWGAWRLIIQAQAGSGQCFTLEPSHGLGRRTRERLRQAHVPERFRAHLPTVVWDERCFAPEQWSLQPHPVKLTIEVLQPPAARAFLHDLIGETAVKLETP